MPWLIKKLINKDVFNQIDNVYATQSHFSEYLAAGGHTYYHFANFDKHYYEIDSQEVPDIEWHNAVCRAVLVLLRDKQKLKRLPPDT